MIQSLNRAKALARERAERDGQPYYVIHVQPGDVDDRGGYAVADAAAVDDIYCASDADIIFATA